MWKTVIYPTALLCLLVEKLASGNGNHLQVKSTWLGLIFPDNIYTAYTDILTYMLVFMLTFYESSVFFI